jgi:hypothetical protein
MSKRLSTSLLFAAAVICASYTGARAQASNTYAEYYDNYYRNYYYSHYANPIFWPFLIVGTAIGTAGFIATLPIRVVCANCLPPPAGFYPFYNPPASPAPSGPAMSYQVR